MAEFWDIYDTNRVKTGKKAQRDVDKLKNGEYHIVVTALIINSKDEILITKRAEHKKHPLKWECNGGSIVAGETSIQGMLREIKEEIGIEVTEKESIFLKEIRRDEAPANFKDIWLFIKDVKDEEITFPDGEAIEFKWVKPEEFIKMKEQNEIIPTNDLELEDFQKALEIKKSLNL